MESAQKDWDDLLLWSINSYDLSANWWIQTHARTSMGVSFPRGWMDGSLIIVTTKDEDSGKDSIQPFSWKSTWKIWLAIVLATVVSAFLFTFFPNRHAGPLVFFFLSFSFMLLLSSVYAADRASFLVAERTSEKFTINSLNDVVINRQSICVWRGSAVEDEILPSAIVVRKSSDHEVLTGAIDGDCNYSVLNHGNYEMIKGLSEVNKDCRLIQVGRNFKTYDIGMAVKSDDGDLCTNLVKDMINVHMKDLHEEGFIEELWSEFHRQKHDITDESCFEGNIVSIETSSNEITFVNVWSIFVVLGSFFLFAISVHFVTNQIRKCNDPPNESDDSLNETTSFNMKEKVVGIESQINDLKNNLSELMEHMETLQGSVEEGFNSDQKNITQDMDLSFEESSYLSPPDF